MENSEIRNAAALAFVGFLLAVAVQEMVVPVRVALQRSGISIESTGLAIVFTLTALTSLFLGQFNLIVTNYRGPLWLLNFLFFVAEAILLVFMGGVATVGSSVHARFGFFNFLIAFYVVEVVWQLATPVFIQPEKRSAAWKALRHYALPLTLPFAILIAISAFADNWYADGPLVFFTVVVAVDFMVTMGLTARDIM